MYACVAWSEIFKHPVFVSQAPCNRYLDDCSENLDNSEVANELENYMDEHFNTELHDDSAMQVAEELLRFHRYCTENNEGLAMAELEKLPPLQSWLVTNEPVRRTQSHPIVEEDSSEGEEESAKDMEVADEWTEVKSRRKR